MSGPVLQLAAFGCLGVGVALILARWASPYVARFAQVRRFRRNLRRLDAVVDAWQHQVEHHRWDDEIRRPHFGNDAGETRFRHPTDPEPGAGAAA